MIVSFTEYELEPRYDGIPWSTVRIHESAAEAGPYTQIDEFALDPLDVNPAHPSKRSFTTDQATLNNGWYKVEFLDAIANVQATDPVYNSPAVEIFATIDDVNGNLDGQVISADSNNSSLVQIGVARIIRAYLGKLVGDGMNAWVSPDTTPATIRQIAGMLIAAQVYFNSAAPTSLLIDDVNYHQRLYDRAMAMLQGIIDGTIDIGLGDVVVAPVDELSELDFFPTDDTDRAFTLSMEL
jgi:hypothetical protein